MQEKIFTELAQNLSALPPEVRAKGIKKYISPLTNPLDVRSKKT